MKLFPTLGASLLMVCIGATAQADVSYDMFASMCGSAISDSSLTLSEDTVTFYESACAITDRKVVSDSITALSLSCGGEGETWTRSIQLEKTANGLRLSDETGSYDYVSCN